VDSEEHSEILSGPGWDGATIKSTITTLYDCPETFELKFRRDRGRHAVDKADAQPVGLHDTGDVLEIPAG